VIQILARIAIVSILCAATVLLVERTTSLLSSPFNYDQNSQSPAPRQPVDDFTSSTKYDPPPLTAFPQTLARPLFFEERQFPKPHPKGTQPVQEVDSTIPPPLPRIAPGTIKLLGVHLDAAGWRALLEVRDQQSAWYQVGQKLEDWEITGIDENSAKLSSPAGQATLELYPKQTVN
jgi:hypothetical protein